MKYYALKEAVAITAARFPYFSVTLGLGLFWDYLEFIDREPLIHPEGNESCTPFSLRSKSAPLYRVITGRNRISVEFIHILTDGAGALAWLKSLLYNYFTLTGQAGKETDGIITPGQPITAEEFEDGYKRFFRKLPPPDKIGNAWHLPWKLMKKESPLVTRISMDPADVLKAAKAHGASVTEYLAAIYFMVLQDIFLEQRRKGNKRMKQILRIEVPVNMRNKLPSVTMRNFSLFVTPGIDMRLGEYTFEEVMQIVKNSIQAGSELKQIGRFLSSNVSYELNPVVRILPLFIKHVAISSIYKGLGQKKFTGILTNMGRVKLPLWMESLVSSLEIVPPPANNKVKISCGVISCKDKLVISFSNRTSVRQFEILYINYLRKAEVKVTLLNN